MNSPVGPPQPLIFITAKGLFIYYTSLDLITGAFLKILSYGFPH